jgi:plasmid replication initiation protein
MSKVEQDIFALFLSRLDKGDWGFGDSEKTKLAVDNDKDIVIQAPCYTFSSGVLCEWLSLKSDDLYNTIKGPSERLSGQKVGLREDGKKKFIFRTLFKEVSYSNATLTIIPNEMLMNEYLCLSKGHSQIDHKVYRSLSSSAKRLYTMLSRFKDPVSGKLHPFSINDLQAFFGLLDEKGQVTKKTYTQIGPIMSRIIKPAMEEIAEREPLIEFIIDNDSGKLGYRYIKSGKRVTHVEFLYSWRNLKLIAQKEADERRKLAEEEPGLHLESAECTYQLVANFVPNDSGNPTSEELTNMMMNVQHLLSKGLVMDSEFMGKYAQAVQEAKFRNV